jgi:hypothetical protein
LGTFKKNFPLLSLRVLRWWTAQCIKKLNASFWLPRNLANRMDRQARTHDTMLVKSREMTGSIQTLPWRRGGRGVKTTDYQIHWPMAPLVKHIKGVFGSYAVIALVTPS